MRSSLLSLRLLRSARRTPLVGGARAPLPLLRETPSSPGPNPPFSDSPITGPFGCRFFSSRPASAVGKSKSLIEDEAELSDWISDLKTDSFRLGLSSDGDVSDSDRRRSGKGSRGRDRGGGVKARDGGRDRVSSSGRKGGSLSRGWDSDSDEFSGFSDRRKLRNSRDSVPKRGFDSDLEDEDDEEEVETRFSSKLGRGRAGRGRVSLASARRGGRDAVSDRRKLRNSRDSVPKRGFDSDLRDEDDEEEVKTRFSSKLGRDRGGRGRVANRRGGRDTDYGSKPARGGRKLDFGLSNEDEEGEDEDDGFSGFEDDFFGDKEGKKEGPLKDEFKNFSSKEPAEGDSTLKKRPEAESDSYLSPTRFDECSLSPLTLKGVKAAGYERMTIVQEATLPAILKGKDVLAKARTGTGKTVAFLLPAIELVSKLPPVDRDNRRPPINVLVVCPTRELADQAAAEATKLLKFHPSIGVQLVIGGTRLALEQKRMQTNPCQILVATPGRLRDHIENTPGFATRLMGVKVLVLDEADRLLDMGFRTDIEKIVVALPKQRQTLLFSATVPDEVRQICYIAMKRDLEFINTVEEGSEETHSQVKQMHLVAPLEKHFSMLYGILTDHISENVDYKVIVFCTTAMVTKLVAELLGELRLNVREIHSRKPQTYRTRVSKEFKESKGLILVSSDVSARGVDYPDVTLVIQLGVPPDREQYIHRLGRTGRKGKEGTGILMLAPWEEFFLRSIKDLPIAESPVPLIDLDTRRKVERALAHVEIKDKESAYQAWLGYYNSNKNIGRDKYQLIALANEFSQSMGLNNPPAIPKLVLRKMGLNNIPGLRSK
ncbi:DEAD-box ATP-dependent RNA helicase 31-like [Ananas comosus]|uniref:ATP-dependent RNA helicase n=1 Tax=Ananas comosus TaxID=4615 RepID=A0A6P5F193_ANACO|nr:DEAD-box ATP-dependent RNA helicase 31-like [Ananas comosus]